MRFRNTKLTKTPRVQQTGTLWRVYGKAGIRNLESGIWNPETESWYGTGTRQIILKVWLASIRLRPSLCIPCKMDDDIRSPFKKRYEYKEHTSYHSGIRNHPESKMWKSNRSKLCNIRSSSALRSFSMQDCVSSVLIIWDPIRTLSNWETCLKKVSGCRLSERVYGDCN